jgi:hypothetical protein
VDRLPPPPEPEGVVDEGVVEVPDVFTWVG